VTLFGPYTLFIMASYVIVAVVVLSLIVWVVADYQRQNAHLRELESQGVVRRSGSTAKDAA
jgi:heme exporter protein D